MSMNDPRITDNTRAALRLAGRACGTHVAEVVSNTTWSAPDTHRRMNLLVRRGHLIEARDAGNAYAGAGHPCVQYFVKQADADAWLALPVGARPNVRLRMPAGMRGRALTLVREAKAPKVRTPKAAKTPSTAKPRLTKLSGPPAVVLRGTPHGGPRDDLRFLTDGERKRRQFAASAQAVIPPGVRVQVIPHQSDTRYAPTTQEQAHAAKRGFTALGVGRYLQQPAGL
jgi:hypothetical protein